VGVKVSVVVPVHDAGEYIGACIESLLGQSLPPEEYEVVFVDDGSTDDSLSVLTEVARRHPHVRVIAMENSGWPGKPRNVGTDAAVGEFVQYVDQDDYLGPEALERMYDLGRAAGADVVVGKMVGVGRWTPSSLFQRNRDDATLFDSDLVTSLTPHKMFRRAFLSEREIRFPEGRRRLEDFLFVMRCYVAASAVAVLADYPCYFYTRRDDGQNTSFQPTDPASYLRNLGEVVAVVDEHVEAGPRRDALLERFYRSEVLGRLSEPHVLDVPDDVLAGIVEVSRTAADDLFSESTRRSLAPVVRARAELLHAGRTTAIAALARRAGLVKARAVANGARWRGEHLVADVTAGLVRSGEPWFVVVEDDEFRLEREFTADLGPADPVVLGRTTAEVLSGVRIQVTVRDRTTCVDWPVDHDLRPSLEAVAGDGSGRRRLRFTGRLWFAPLTMAGGRPLERGSWDVSVRITAWGLTRTARMAVGPGMRPAQLPRRLRDGRLTVVPYPTDHGNLTLDVGERLKKWTPPEPRGPGDRLRHQLRRRAPGTVRSLVRFVRSGRRRRDAPLRRSLGR